MTPLVLFDLDGTLIDSAPGIISTLRIMCDEIGVPRFDAATERGFLGPPLVARLGRLLGPERRDEAVAVYRRHYAERGMYEIGLYDGIQTLLDALRRAGVTMAVATSKPEKTAVDILAELGLGDYFATVGGDTFDSARHTKAQVIAEVFARIGHPPSVVMVGDRAQDVDGARAAGIPCVGVEWGYGEPGELAGADAIVASPAELGRYLLGGVADAASA